MMPLLSHFTYTFAAIANISMKLFMLMERNMLAIYIIWREWWCSQSTAVFPKSGQQIIILWLHIPTCWLKGIMVFKHQIISCFHRILALSSFLVFSFIIWVHPRTVPHSRLRKSVVIHWTTAAKTMRCRYNACDFLLDHHHIHTIDYPTGEVWGALCESFVSLFSVRLKYNL